MNESIPETVNQDLFDLGSNEDFRLTVTCRDLKYTAEIQIVNLMGETVREAESDIEEHDDAASAIAKALERLEKTL